MSQISITPLVQHHQYSYKFDNIVATALMNQQNPPMPYSIMRLTIFLLLLMAASSLTPKIYLIGGASLQAQALIFEQLAKLVPQRTPQPNKCDENWQTTACPRIAVATSAAESQAAGDQVYTTDDESGLSYHSLFMLYGMAPKHLSIHRDNFRSHGNISTPQGMANLQTIYQADIVFFNGGDQTRHLRSWLNDDATPNALLSLLRLRAGRHQVILAGSSAGSMIWGLYTFGGGSAFGMLYFRNSVGLAPKNIADAEIGDDAICDTRNGTDSLQYDYNGVVMPAIGLIDFLVDTHFEARGRLGRLPAAMTALRVSLGVGIDQKTAFYYNNGTGTVYGYNGVTICDMSNAIVPPSKYFTATGIEGSYLTAGDSYDFKTKTVISSKKEINTPKYSEATDSNDILDSYQASLLSSRVVDQKALFNLGRTQTPPNFPKETPKFEIKFYRNSQSKGYFNDNKYTVSKILYDYSYGANSFNLRVEEDTK